PERLLSLDWRENDFLRFWMGRSSPLVAVGREIIEQKDFLGRRLDQPDDWIRTVGVHFLTIAAQNLITRDPSEEEGKFKRFGAEIFGLRTFPRGDWRRLEDMENEYAQREFKKPFDDLNREQKDQIQEKYPEYKALSDDAREKMTWESGEDFEQWTLASEQMANSEYHAIGEQMARSLFAGMIDYRTYLGWCLMLAEVLERMALSCSRLSLALVWGLAPALVQVLVRVLVLSVQPRPFPLPQLGL
ncbi:unnamed protein product, partial [marine sediment metagenome]